VYILQKSALNQHLLNLIAPIVRTCFSLIVYNRSSGVDDFMKGTSTINHHNKPACIQPILFANVGFTKNCFLLNDSNDKWRASSYFRTKSIPYTKVWQKVSVSKTVCL